MDAKLKADWVKALRSGEFKQARSSIGNVNQKCLCCLGVGAVVARPSIDLRCTTDAIYELSKHGFVGWTGPLNDEFSALTRQLIDQNDRYGKSFAEIADWIEQNL